MGALDGVRAAWNDPRKRPWMIAGGAATATAGIYALRRPTDEGEAAAEDTAVETSIAPELGTDAPFGATAYGELPAVYVQGGGMGGYDAGFAETDLSGVYAELDALGVAQQTALDEALEGERAARRRIGNRARRAEDVAERARTRALEAKKKNKRQARQIARLKRRVAKTGASKRKNTTRPSSRAKATRTRARRRARTGRA